MPEILIPKQWSWRDLLKLAEDPGRKRGQTAGTFIDDLSQCQKTIILCPMCIHAMNWRRKGYYNIMHFEQIQCRGTCDGCRNQTDRGVLLIHETNVDSCWMRKDEGRKFRPMRHSPRTR